MLWWVVGGCLLSLLLYIYLRPVADNGGGTLSNFLLDPRVEPGQVKTQRANDRYLAAHTTAGRQVLILYGTEYGSSETLAQKAFDAIFAMSADLLLQPRLVNMKDYKHLDWNKETTALVICSTAGDGDAPVEAKGFFDWLQTEAGQSLTGLRYVLAALGDSNYLHFCRAGRVLNDLLQAAGANQMGLETEVDQCDWDTINQWLATAITFLNNVAETIPIEHDYWMPISENQGTYGRNNPFLATLIGLELLTTDKCGDDKKVMRVDFNLEGSGFEYQPGDALAIYPENTPQEVQWLLNAMHCTGTELVEMPNHPGLLCRLAQPLNATVSLREALTSAFDLRGVTPHMVKAIGQCLPPGARLAEAERLLIGGMSLKDNTPLAEFLQAKEVVDVVEALAGPHPVSAAPLLATLGPLLPRYYSLSSTPSTCSTIAVMTIATVNYRLHGRDRVGVCSTYIAERLDIGQSVPVFVSPNPHFRLPGSLTTPSIMIGPGTGVAPFIAFLQERTKTPIGGMPKSGKEPIGNEQSQPISRGSLPANVLFVGCRRRDEDFLWRDYVERREEANQVKVLRAFSREGPQKVYVQDKMAEESAMLWALLQAGAHVYICGSASPMAKDVYSCLLRLVAAEGRMTSGESKKYVQWLQTSGRLAMDVW